MQRQNGDLNVNWRYFPLEQVNSDEGDDWKLWEQPDDYKSKGRPAFQAAEAARQQGPDAFDRFHMALLKAKHEDGKAHNKDTTLTEAARTAGLDLERFQRERKDRSTLAKIGADYEEATTRYGTFGTPTIVFPNGAAGYLKLNPKALPDDPVEFWDDFVATIRDRPAVLEIKRPTKPE